MAIVGILVTLCFAIIAIGLFIMSLGRVMRAGLEDTAKAIWVLIILLTFPIGSIVALVMLSDE